MSHTTSVEGIVFSDIEALKATVNELVREGVRCALVKDSTPRAYYANQKGMEKADYVLRLDDAPYDVGFYKDTAKKGYVARTDLFMNHVGRILGATARTGESPTQAALGRLYRTYAVHAATRKAVQQGMTVRRVNKEDGSVQLVISGIK